ncbi:MAG: 30S ribosomal protein S2 [Patescibacteria group bacterium]
MTETAINDEQVLELAKLGVLYGHKKSKTHPRMKPVIVDNKNEIELLDPEAVLDSLRIALDFLKEKASKGMLMFIVGTLPSAKEVVKSVAEELKYPYVVSRWLGGTITNFDVIRKRESYYESLKAKKASGELSKYTKKEQSKFSEEISKLAKNFDGLANLTKRPDVLFVVDIKTHDTAVKEAKTAGIPIVAILDTDDDPKLVNYPIFANDHGKGSVEWVMEQVRTAVKEATQAVKEVTQVVKL